MSIKHPIAAVLVCTAVGCASTATKNSSEEPISGYREVANPHFAFIAAAESAQAKDRAAILAMQGDYRVDFRFQETVPLQAGYERREDKTTGGFETVVVLENTPNHIVLQHILVAPGGHVVKHWRQDWSFEVAQRFEFIADQTWEVRGLDAATVAASWTQCVFEVSDAPRYCGTGQWNHRYGVSTWTGDRSWRPLPRREYTKRDDYNALNSENRHTITPNGWTHEQDNTKTVRDGQRTATTLVREFGFNDYRRISGYDFEPARTYWEATADYWSRVRAAWERRLQGGARLTLGTDVDGMPIIVGTFAQAEQAGETSAAEQRESIEALLQQWSTVSRSISAYPGR
ncbi:MAG: DUF6607 family protein [Pseudomonadales bacterium]